MVRGEDNTTDLISGSNGVLEANMTYAPGEVGMAFSDDGNGSAVSLGSLPALELQNFTIELWISRSDTNLVTESAFFPSGLFFSGGYGGYGFGLLTNGVPFFTTLNLGNVTGGQPITDTSFHHMAVTKNGSSVVIFEDGVATFETNYSSTFSFEYGFAIGEIGRAHV